MPSAARILLATTTALCALACTSPAPGAPTPANTPASNVTGNWTGTGMDSQGATRVTWALSQSGTSVVGTVKTQAVDPADGSCGSCHRNKSGTFTGTISSAGLNLTMFFAAGADGDPTPACTATLTGLASSADADQLRITYSGSDSCEGSFENGTLSMTRR